MTSREERMAQNEATSREVNEDVEGMHQVDPPGRRIQIVCECAPRWVWSRYRYHGGRVPAGPA